MTTKDIDIHLKIPESLLKHWGKTPEEAKDQIMENEVLALLSLGKIEIEEAASLLSCDPEELLTPDEESELISGIHEYESGDFSDWEEVKQRLS